jgi:hypothetical protein
VTPHSRLTLLRISDHSVRLDTRTAVLDGGKIGAVEIPAKFGFQDVPPVRRASDDSADFRVVRSLQPTNEAVDIPIEAIDHGHLDSPLQPTEHDPSGKYEALR